MNTIHKHQKLTMQKLVELKDKKVWDSIYIKCHFCGQFKPAKEGILLEGHPTSESETLKNGSVAIRIKQVYEVICSDCEKVLP